MTAVQAGRPSAEWFDRPPPRHPDPAGRDLALTLPWLASLRALCRTTSFVPTRRPPGERQGLV